MPRSRTRGIPRFLECSPFFKWPHGCMIDAGMRKLLLWVGVGLLVAGVAVGIFIATFDADRYRPLVVGKLQEALGVPVKLDRISMGWRGGIAVNLKRLALYPEPKGIYADLQGKLEPSVQVDEISLLLRPLPLLKKQLEIASVELRQMIARPSDYGLKGSGEWVVDQAVLEGTVGEDQVDLKNLTARIGQGRIHLSGKAENLKSELEIQFKISAERLVLEKLLSIPAGQPHLAGAMSASFQGTVQGMSWDSLSKTLSGRGRVQIARPVLMNFNLLQEVFGRISIIPGLVEVLQSRLPREYREKLNSRDTIFEPIDFTMNVSQGVAEFENLQLATDTFTLNGTGRLGLDGALSSQMQLRIDPELSQAFVRSVKELGSLVGSDGRMTLPVRVEGPLPRVAVLPDVSYLASRLVVHKGEELFRGLLGEVLEKATH